MAKRTDKAILPAFLASAIINGDVSGLEEGDNKWLEAALKYAEPGYYVDVGESYFSKSTDLPLRWGGGDVAEYTIMYSDEGAEEKKSMTWGVLPSKAAFTKAFEREVPEGERFTVERDPWAGTQHYTLAQLWAAVNKAVEEFEEDGDLDSPAAQFASSVMTVLGFEWI